MATELGTAAGGALFHQTLDARLIRAGEADVAICGGSVACIDLVSRFDTVMPISAADLKESDAQFAAALRSREDQFS